MYRVRYNSITNKYEFDVYVNNGYQTDVRGTLNQVSEYALNFIEESELNFAYEIMNKNEHTIAEFGYLGKFIFSK